MSAACRSRLVRASEPLRMRRIRSPSRCSVSTSLKPITRAMASDGRAGPPHSRRPRASRSRSRLVSSTGTAASSGRLQRRTTCSDVKRSSAIAPILACDSAAGGPHHSDPDGAQPGRRRHTARGADPVRVMLADDAALFRSRSTTPSAPQGSGVRVPLVARRRRSPVGPGVRTSVATRLNEKSSRRVSAHRGRSQAEAVPAVLPAGRLTFGCGTAWIPWA